MRLHLKRRYLEQDIAITRLVNHKIYLHLSRRKMHFTRTKLNLSYAANRHPTIPGEKTLYYIMTGGDKITEHLRGHFHWTTTAAAAGGEEESSNTR